MEETPQALSEHRYNIINVRANVAACISSVAGVDQTCDDVATSECCNNENDNESICEKSTSKCNELARDAYETNQMSHLYSCEDAGETHENTSPVGSSARCSENNYQCNNKINSSRSADWEAYSDVYVAPNTPYVCNKESKREYYSFNELLKNVTVSNTTPSNINICCKTDVTHTNNNLESRNIVNNSMTLEESSECTSVHTVNNSNVSAKNAVSASNESINLQPLQPYIKLLRWHMEHRQSSGINNDSSNEQINASPIFTYAFQRKLADRLRQRVVEAHFNNNNICKISKTEEMSKLHKMYNNVKIATKENVLHNACKQVNGTVTLPSTIAQKDICLPLDVNSSTSKESSSSLEEEKKCSSQSSIALSSSNTSNENSVSVERSSSNTDADKTHLYFVNLSHTQKQKYHEEVARTLFATPAHLCMENDATIVAKNDCKVDDDENSIKEHSRTSESLLLSSTFHKSSLSTLPTSTASPTHFIEKAESVKELDKLRKCLPDTYESESKTQQATKQINIKNPKVRKTQQRETCVSKSTPLCDVATTMEPENKLNKAWEELVQTRLDVALQKWQTVLFIKVRYLSLHCELHANQAGSTENDIEAAATPLHEQLKKCMEWRAQLRKAIASAEHASTCVAQGMRHYVEKMNAVILQLLNVHQYSFALQLLLKADELVKKGAGMEFVLDKLICNSEEIITREARSGVTTSADANGTHYGNKETKMGAKDDDNNSAGECGTSIIYIDEIDTQVLAQCCGKNAEQTKECCNDDITLNDNVALPVTVHIKHAITHHSSTKLREPERVQKMLSLHLPYFTHAETPLRVYCTSITYNNFGLYHYHIGEYALAVERLQEAVILEAQLQQQQQSQEQQEYVKLPGVTSFNLAQAQFMAYKEQQQKHCGNNTLKRDVESWSALDTDHFGKNMCNSKTSLPIRFHKTNTFNYFRSLERATQLTIDKLHELTRQHEQHVRAQEEREQQICFLSKVHKWPQHRIEEEETLPRQSKISDSFVELDKADDVFTFDTSAAERELIETDCSLINVKSATRTNMHCNEDISHPASEFVQEHSHLMDEKVHVDDDVPVNEKIANKNNTNVEDDYISTRSKKKVNTHFAKQTEEENSVYTRTLSLWLQKREQLCLLVRIKSAETEMYLSLYEYENALRAVNRAVMWCKEISNRTESEERQLETIIALEQKIRQKCERRKLERAMYGRTVPHNRRKVVKTANIIKDNSSNVSASQFFSVNNARFAECGANRSLLLNADHTSMPIFSASRRHCTSNTLINDHTRVATTLLPRTIHIIDQVHQNCFEVTPSLPPPLLPTQNSEQPSKKLKVSTNNKVKELTHEISSETRQGSVRCSSSAESEQSLSLKHSSKIEEQREGELEQKEELEQSYGMWHGRDRCKTTSRMQPFASRHTTPYMTRKCVSSAPIQSKKAWDSDTRIPAARKSHKTQEEAKSSIALASAQQDNDKLAHRKEHASKSCLHEHDNIVTDGANVKTLCNYTKCEQNRWSISKDNYHSETNNNDVVVSTLRARKHDSKGMVGCKDIIKRNNNSNTNEESSQSSPSLSSTSSFFRTKLQTSCEESRNNGNVMSTLISCVDIINAFIRCKLSKSIVERACSTLIERNCISSKELCSPVQSTLRLKEKHESNTCNGDTSGVDALDNKIMNKSGNDSSNISICNSHRQNAQNTTKGENEPTKSFEMLFIHSDSKRQLNEHFTSEEHDANDCDFVLNDHNSAN